MRHIEHVLLECLRRAVDGQIELGLETELRQIAGFDSVTMASFLAEVEDRFSIILSPKVVGSVQTLDELVPLVCAELSGTARDATLPTTLAPVNQEYLRAQRYGRAVTVVLLRQRLEAASAVEEARGWASLTAVGRSLRASLRNSDAVISLGHELLVVLLPETPPTVAATLVQRWSGAKAASPPVFARCVPLYEVEPSSALSVAAGQWVHLEALASVPAAGLGIRQKFSLSWEGERAEVELVELRGSRCVLRLSGAVPRSATLTPEGTLDGWPVRVESFSSVGPELFSCEVKALEGKDARTVQRALAASALRSIRDQALGAT